MKPTAILLAWFTAAVPVYSADVFDVDGDVEAIQQIDTKLDSGAVAAADAERLRQERERRVGRIEQAGEKKPDDIRRQNEVARALTKVNEGERALPFAERTVALAEKTGKGETIAAALTTSALAYQAAGRYEEAYARAKRALDLDPGNREAKAAYYVVKGREYPMKGAASVPSTALGERVSGQVPRRPHIEFTPVIKRIRQPPPLDLAPEPRARAEVDTSLSEAQRYYSPLCMKGDGYACDAREISQNCFGSDNSNQCVRVCLIAIDDACQNPRWLSKSSCRAVAHIRCYAKCGKMMPTIYEHSCYSRIWRGFGIKPNR
jgi:tetratricopeptide (TPR) repeat protein